MKVWLVCLECYGNVDAGLVDHIEDGGGVLGAVVREDGRIEATHGSSTKAWAHNDLMYHAKRIEDVKNIEIIDLVDKNYDEIPDEVKEIVKKNGSKFEVLE